MSDEKRSEWLRKLNTADLDKVSGGQFSEGADVYRCYNCHEFHYSERPTTDKKLCLTCGCTSWSYGIYGDESSFKPEGVNYNCGYCECSRKMYCKK